jgi:hypothetical protein
MKKIPCPWCECRGWLTRKEIESYGESKSPAVPLDRKAVIKRLREIAFLENDNVFHDLEDKLVLTNWSSEYIADKICAHFSTPSVGLPDVDDEKYDDNWPDDSLEEFIWRRCGTDNRRVREIISEINSRLKGKG